MELSSLIYYKGLYSRTLSMQNLFGHKIGEIELLFTLIISKMYRHNNKKGVFFFQETVENGGIKNNNVY